VLALPAPVPRTTTAFDRNAPTRRPHRHSSRGSADGSSRPPAIMKWCGAQTENTEQCGATYVPTARLHSHLARSAHARHRSSLRTKASPPRSAVRHKRAAPGRCEGRRPVQTSSLPKPGAWRASHPRQACVVACEQSPQSWPRTGISGRPRNPTTPAASATCSRPEGIGIRWWR
jgi:hypothetical protein